MSLRLLALASLVAIVPSACIQVQGDTSAPVAPPAGEFPFTFQGAGDAAIVVPVRLNGRGPYDFVLDTGATLTCLDASLARELELSAARGVVGRAATLGSTGGVDVYRLDSLAIGDAAVKDLMVCALDLQHIRAAGLDVDGLVGLNVLKQYKVTFDFERRMLRLDP